jgi:transportin-1
MKLYRQNPHAYPPPDKDFIIVALDLMGAVVQAIGEKSELLINSGYEPNLFTILRHTMQDEASDVRSCSFAVLGDIAGSCSNVISPHLNDVMQCVLANFNAIKDKSAVSAMNNAAWSAGEIAIRYPPEVMEPYTKPLLEKMIAILLAPDTSRSLSENAAITIGRLGYVCPHVVAPYLDQFISFWCLALGDSPDNLEKASAFTGLCKVIVQNPNGVSNGFLDFCGALLKWDVTKHTEMKTLFGQVFQANLDASNV